MIHVHYYETTTPPVPPVVFLAGPTTDSRPGPWRGEFEGQPLSAWRADLAHELQRQGWSGTLVVPEFYKKGDSGEWFQEARARLGWDGEAVVRWEERQMRDADTVVAWADVRREGPAVGLNARPELYGLVLRYHARQAVYRALTGDDRDEPRGLLQLCHRLLRTMPWGPRYLVLGLPASAQKVSRFREAAAEAALPVHTTLVDVARAVAR